jgi:hypothetical protein
VRDFDQGRSTNFKLRIKKEVLKIIKECYFSKADIIFLLER